MIEGSCWMCLLFELLTLKRFLLKQVFGQEFVAC